MQWHIGCSGFYYRHWKGVFYPNDMPQRLWFDHYCQHFSTVELNGTFYSFPKTETLKRWYRDSPMEFTFAVKAHRIITHYKQFNNTYDTVNQLYDIVSNALQEKLGTILFQMPPRYSYTPQRLDNIITNLNPVFNNVLEPRHESWWQPDIYHELAKYNISFCGMSHPQLPETVVANTPVLYYRLHGNQQLYSSAYSTAELQQLVDEVKATDAKQAYIYFNNDIGASAIYNSEEMIKMIR